MALNKNLAGLALVLTIILTAWFNGCIETADVNGATVSVDKNAYTVEIIAPADHGGEYVVEFYYEGAKGNTITHGSWAGYLVPGETKEIVDEYPIKGKLLLKVSFDGVPRVF